MILTKPQSSIFLSRARFRVVVAGRRFGKTFLSVSELLDKSLSGRNRNCWYIAPTYGSAKEIAWDMMVDRVPKEYLTKPPNETTLTISMRNGSKMSLKGAEKPNNLRGRSLDFAVLDEFADMKPETWNEVIRPSLADRKGSALFIGTPKGMNHFRDLWSLGVDGTPDWQSWQYTTLQGGNVTQEEIEAARRDMDERTFKQEFEASFVNYSGIIYYNFDRTDSVVAAADDKSTLLVGMDFNLDPMSAVVAIRKDDLVFVIDEVVIYSSNTDEMVDELKNRYPGRDIVVYPDPASKQRKTSAGGRTDLSILQNAGFRVKVKNTHSPVRDRINSVNARLKSADGVRHLFIHPKCKNTIKSLERQTYKSGTSQPDKESGFDHMNDALGYLIDTLFPIRTEYQAETPTRWT